MKKLNLVGKKFGRLTVVKLAYIKNGRTYWKCKCQCGNIHFAKGVFLTFGCTKSCGCLQRTVNLQHGMYKTRFYKIWKDMKIRCLNKNNHAFQDYGGRGITVCKQWLKFENFHNDMYKSYKEHCDKYDKNNTSIDRINNNGSYCKKNCKWSTRIEQMNNTRHNRFLSHNGQTLTIAQWCKKLNFKKHILNTRLNRYGWSISKTLTTPVKIYKKRKS